MAFNLYNIPEGKKHIEFGEWDDTNAFSKTLDREDRCYVGLYDDDLANSEDDYVSYRPGAVVEKNGPFSTSNLDEVVVEGEEAESTHSREPTSSETS